MNNIYADLLCSEKGDKRPRIKTTYETPSLVHPVVTIMSYPELYDMVGSLAKRRAEFKKRIREMNSPESRLAAIDAMLGEVTDTETVNNLLEEKAEILIELEKE